MGETPQPTIRLAYIDKLKGLAMLLVVMGHLFVFCGLGDQNLIVDTIVLVNMPLFLFLNGLVVRKLTFVNGGGYLWRKFRQIMIPFFLWGILITLFRHDTYLNFLTSYWKFGYWYLLVLFEFYIIIGLVNAATSIMCRGIGGRILNIAIVVLTALPYVIMRLTAPHISTDFSVISDFYQAVDYYPYFAVGFLMMQFRLLKSSCSPIILTITLLLSGGGYYYWQMGLNSEWFVIALRFFIILMVVTLFMSIGESDNREKKSIGKILSTIGRHSLAIYMLQFFMFRYINLTDVYSYFNNSGNILANIAVTALCAIIICYLCIVIERIIHRTVYLRFLIGK